VRDDVQRGAVAVLMLEQARDRDLAVGQTVRDASERAEIVRRRLSFERDPAAFAERFAEQAQRAGVVMEAIRFPYGDHAFNLNQYGIGNQFYLGVTEQFLQAHGQRPGASTAASHAETRE